MAEDFERPAFARPEASAEDFGFPYIPNEMLEDVNRRRDLMRRGDPAQTERAPVEIEPFVGTYRYDPRREIEAGMGEIGRQAESTKASQRGMLSRLGMTGGGAELGVEAGVGRARGEAAAGVRSRAMRTQYEYDNMAAARKTAYNQWKTALINGNEEAAADREHEYNMLTEQLRAMAAESDKQRAAEEESLWDTFASGVVDTITGAVVGGPAGAVAGAGKNLLGLGEGD